MGKIDEALGTPAGMRYDLLRGENVGPGSGLMEKVRGIFESKGPAQYREPTAGLVDPQLKKWAASAWVKMSPEMQGQFGDFQGFLKEVVAGGGQAAISGLSGVDSSAWGG